MTLSRVLLGVMACVLLSYGAAASQVGVETSPPDAPARPVETTLHGDTRVDEYAWIRNKSNPEVIEYLEAENKYTDETTAHTEELQKALYEEMLARIKQDDVDVPYIKDGYLYYSRSEEGKPYEIYCRRKGEGGAEEVILDVNQRAQGKEYTSVEAMDVSPNAKLLAWLEDSSGYERCDLFVKDLETGKIIESSLHELDPWSLAWANDNQTLFYARQDDANRADRIYRHRIGTNPDEDVLVYHDPDGRFYVSVGRTRSGEWVVFTSESQITSEHHVLSADDPTGTPTVVEPRRHGVEYSLADRGDEFFILTNDDAKNFRIVRTPVDNPGKSNWSDLVAHDPDVYLRGIEAFKGHLVVSQRRDGYMGLRVLDLENGTDRILDMPEAVSTASPSVNEEFDTDVFRFEYESFVTPSSIIEENLSTGERRVLKQREVLGGYDPAEYETTRLVATGHDGVKIPISMVYRKGLRPDGTNPVVLYGYGSYGSSSDPYFSSNRLSLLDRGVIYAIGHIRGGSELGRSWYEDGKFLQKKNTFKDFISCAEALRDSGWAAPDRIAIEGGSAGGLLVGATINMRPELFRAAIAEVPFVDVMNTMLDPSIPLTIGEYDEWGNPEDPVYYRYMKTYSPYDNVGEQAYPPLLVTAGLNDPRVHYWEPAKWVARMRDHADEDQVLLLKTNMGAGHGGASGRYDRLREIAFQHAFMLDHLGALDVTDEVN